MVVCLSLYYSSNCPCTTLGMVVCLSLGMVVCLSLGMVVCLYYSSNGGVPACPCTTKDGGVPDLVLL